MQTNKELKIALIVGIIMITICLLVFIFAKSSNDKNEIDIQVYKVNEEAKTYEPCSVPQEKLIQINSEYNSASKLTESSRVIGGKITGTYKVVSKGNYIAFDAEKDKNYVFRGDTKYLYEFNSELYEIVKEVCK